MFNQERSILAIKHRVGIVHGMTSAEQAERVEIEMFVASPKRRAATLGRLHVAERTWSEKSS